MVENWLDKINTHTRRILLLSTSHNKKQGIKKVVLYLVRLMMNIGFLLLCIHS